MYLLNKMRHFQLVKYHNGFLEVIFSLEWKMYIYIEYHIKFQWPLLKNVAHFEVHVSGKQGYY